MAVATLERCYNNYNVFTGVVKIRKGEAVRLMMEATTLNKVKAIMTHFATNVSNVSLRMHTRNFDYSQLLQNYGLVIKTDILTADFGKLI